MTPVHIPEHVRISPSTYPNPAQPSLAPREIEIGFVLPQTADARVIRLGPCQLTGSDTDITVILPDGADGDAGRPVVIDACISISISISTSLSALRAASGCLARLLGLPHLVPAPAAALVAAPDGVALDHGAAEASVEFGVEGRVRRLQLAADEPAEEDIAVRLHVLVEDDEAGAGVVEAERPFRQERDAVAGV